MRAVESLAIAGVAKQNSGTLKTSRYAADM